MRWIALGILGSRLFASSFDDVSPSWPDEVASHSQKLLVEEVIFPISGQISLCETDLHVKGAQELVLKRNYIPPHIKGRYDERDEVDRFLLGKALLHHESWSWALLPQMWAGYNKHSEHFLVRDDQGLVLEFEVVEGRGILKTAPFGMSNWREGEPDGSADLRNTELWVEGTQARVIWPNGIERIYSLQGEKLYRLDLERLPNGKAIRYEYGLRGLERIASCDPSGQISYASIEKRSDHNYTASDGNASHFSYEMKEITGRCKEGGLRRKVDYKIRVLAKVINPIYSNEMKYNDRLLLTFYDTKNYPISFEYQQGEGVRIKRLATPFHTTSFSYDLPIAGQKGGSTSAKQSHGIETVYQYDQNLLLVGLGKWTRGTLIQQTSYAYDEKQHLIRVEMRDAEGTCLFAKQYECDEFGNAVLERFEGDFGTFEVHKEFSKNRVISEKREGGLGYAYTYVGDTRLLASKTTLFFGKPVRRSIYNYDEAYNLIEEREEGYRSTKYTYYQEGHCIHRIEWKEELDAEGGSFGKVHFSYDQWGHCCEEAHYDQEGHFIYALQRTYNSVGDLLEEVNPFGQIASYQYDTRGRCIIENPFSGKLTIYRTFDGMGRLIQLNEDNLITSFTYNDQNQLIEKVDPIGLKTSYTYDFLCDKPTRIEAPPTLALFRYNALGQEIERSDAYGATTLTRYSNHGKPSEILHSDGTKETFLYDTGGFLIQHAKGEEWIATYERDPLGRVIAKTVGDETTRYVYDSYLLLKEETRGFETSYVYDAKGRKVEEIRAGRKSRFGYDALGYLSWEERGGHRISYRNDVVGRVVEESVDGILKISRKYDSSGNVISLCRGGCLFFLYDGYNRLIEKKDPEKGKTRITYQKGTQMWIKRTKEPSGITLSETYNAHGLLVKREILGHLVEKFEYDRALRLVRHDYQTFGFPLDGYDSSLGKVDLKTTLWAYTLDGKIKTKTKPDGKVLHYEYNSQGLLTRVGDQEFKYDALGRLVSGSGFTRSFDPFGNIVREEFASGLWVKSTYDDWDRPSTRTLPDKSRIVYEYEGPFLKKSTHFDPKGKILSSRIHGEHEAIDSLLSEAGSLVLAIDPF